MTRLVVTAMLAGLVTAMTSWIAWCGPAADDAAPKAAGGVARMAPDETASDRMAWWREARFGLFIHWGLYAIPAGEWNGNTGHAEWIRHTAQIPIERYEQFVDQFNPTAFDADAWVRLAKQAGMRYIVITSKHHDGFCLFDSKYTDFDVMSTPFKRDIMKELSEACRRQGLKICWYHSIMDWHHPDYLPRRGWEDRSADGADFDRYVEHLRNQVTELLTNYGPIGVMWFDGEWESTWTHEYGRALYDLCRKLQPRVIVNNRVDVGRSGMAGMTAGGDRAGDYGTPEQRIPETGLPGVDWETCMTMNDHWGYNKNDHEWKSVEQIIRMLVDIASKGGNYLLNVGPEADGTFPGPAVERLRAIGRWMAANGQAIYGTQASPLQGLSWGRCTMKPMNKGGEAATRLYLHVFEWPEDGRLVIGGLGNEILRAFPLARPDAGLEVSTGSGTVSIAVGPTAPDPICSVIALEIVGEPLVYEAPRIIFESPWVVRPVRVALEIDSRKLDIRYTTDGTDPTPASPSYAKPLLITRTTVVKAQAFHGEKPVSKVVAQRLERIPPRAGQEVHGLEPGLACEIFEGHWDLLPDFDPLEPTRREVAATVGLGGSHAEYVARRFRGYLQIPDDDVYRMGLASDDGSRLIVDNEVVIDNDGLHGMRGATAPVALARGFHPITVLWFNKTGGAELALEIAGTGRKMRAVPERWLFRRSGR